VLRLARGLRMIAAIHQRRNRMAFDTIFLNARFDGGSRHHIAVKDGRIAAINSTDDVPTGADYKANLNPNSLVVLKEALVEPSLATAKPCDRFQFERQGYFCADSVDSKPGAPIFNRTVSLRDTWAKIEKKG